MKPRLLDAAGAFSMRSYSFRQVLQDTIDVEIDDGLGAFGGLKKGHILAIIHKEVLGQDCRAAGVTDDVEVLFDVGISVGVIGPEAHSWQMAFRSLVQAGCQGVGLGLTPGCVAAPAAGIEPILTVSGCIDVDGEENHLVVAEPPADGVYATAALLQRDVSAFRDDELAVQAEGRESFPDQESEVAVVGVFAEVAVGAPLAGSVKAVAVVEKNLHSCRLCSDGKLKIICGNTYFPEIPLSLQRMYPVKDIH